MLKCRSNNTSSSNMAGDIIENGNKDNGNMNYTQYSRQYDKVIID